MRPALFSARGKRQIQIPALFLMSNLQSNRNQNLSHVTTGFTKNSPSQSFCKVDEAFNGSLATYFFHYANSTKEGLVDNTMTTFSHKSNEPTIWKGFVNSNFPLTPEDLLVKNDAFFGGLVQQQFNELLVAAVSSLSNIKYIRDDKKGRQNSELP